MSARTQSGASTTGTVDSRKQGVGSVCATMDSQSVMKRLQTELMALMASQDPGVSAFPDGDSLFTWVGTIAGAVGTAYEGLSFKLSLQFPTDYPFKAPLVRFVTPCFHPNVDNAGNICLDILKDKWSAAYSVKTVLISIQSLLGEPNNDSPLNNYAAKLWDNQEEFRKAVHKRYAEQQPQK